MTNILKFGILMLLLLVAHQNPYCYYPYSSHVYGLGNPVNFIDPSGMTVIATSEEAQEMIKNTLPKDAREFLKFDENGVLDAAVLSGYSNESESQNFSNLLSMALSSDYTFEIFVSESFDYMNRAKEIGVQDMVDIEIDSDQEDYGMGLRTDEVGWYGHHGLPGIDREQNSTNEKIQITINSRLSSEGRAQGLSHELYGHGYLYMLYWGNPDMSLHKPHLQYETNKTLYKRIMNSISETIKNMH